MVRTVLLALQMHGLHGIVNREFVTLVQRGGNLLIGVIKAGIQSWVNYNLWYI